MKNNHLLATVTALLCASITTDAQILRKQSLHNTAVCPGCELDTASSFRLIAQSAPIPRGERLSGSVILPAETRSSGTNLSGRSNSAMTNAFVKIKDGDLIGFKQLSWFPFALTPELEYTTNHMASADAKVNAMIPPQIKACEGKTMSIDGFMVPLDFKNGKVSNFVLARSQFSCCYGDTPQMHELIFVNMKGPEVKASHLPVRITGILHVGAQRTNGFLTCIYHMDATTVVATP
ncbi:MAG: hypothetical protein JWM04_11 [Verrucomicrobiales bacterium]|nr:hypothetical protein [Verrucomicrobiales bacterium]